MTPQLKKEIQEIIKNLRLSCSIEEFKNTTYWSYLDENTYLSEDL